jgi:phosphopentomutase
MTINRVIVVVLDSVGIGEAPDAAAFGDLGSHTLGNIARAMGGLHVPHLARLGLGNIAALEGVPPTQAPQGAYAKMAEQSAGKDTSTGHWELMGVKVTQAFPVYPDGFPPEVMERFEAAIGRGTLGNKAASGTTILDELGDEHVRTGKPIIYTSADSVFQIAAHEEVVPLEQLYEMCRIAREQLRGQHEVLRVIARPFVGRSGAWERTSNRRDFSVTPPAPTVLEKLKDAGLMVYAIGKIEDIFAGVGITDAVHTEHNMDGVDRTIEAIKQQKRRGLIFTNLVDFDAKFGHRNNVQGYAAALAAFDQRMPDLLKSLRNDDLLVITADHGNDPTTPSTDHSREFVPILLAGPQVKAGTNLGVRSSFADLGATICDIFDLEQPALGTSFKDEALTA